MPHWVGWTGQTDNKGWFIDSPNQRVPVPTAFMYPTPRKCNYFYYRVRLWMRSGERKGARGQERIDLTLFMFGKIIKYVFFFSFLESLIVHARWLFFRQDLSFNVPMSSPAWISFMGFRTFSVSLHFIQTRPPPPLLIVPLLPTFPPTTIFLFSHSPLICFSHFYKIQLFYLFVQIGICL